MRHSLLLLVPAIALLASCGASAPDTDAQVAAKRAERDSLKAAREKLNASIAEVEGWLAANDPAMQRSLPMVTTYSLQSQPFAHWTEAHGSVRADENALVFSATGGKVRRILVQQGQSVKQGQAIVDIDVDALREGVRQAQAQAELARTVYEKQARLWEQKIGSEVQFLQAKANMESSAAQVKSMMDQVSSAEVRAPFDGVVDAIFPNLGDMANPMQPVARVVSLGKASIECDLAEDLLTKVKPGDSVEVHIPETREKHMATIAQVGQYINPANRSFKATLRMDNGTKLRPNQLLNVRIRDLMVADAIVVPSRLVMQNSAGESYVFTLDQENGTPRSRKIFVKVLSTQGGDMLLESSDALKGDVTLIDQGARLVVDKQEVQVMKGA
ncbi:MAG: efflux RND transporter periplasmic adaptor subunit [Flavobacteriales bacterium]|jgi:RND family efflux transporter MFP subunit|nr:efflux RND transporter periplasmic adaptor subunit [Flavobacteriales bacterium]